MLLYGVNVTLTNAMEYRRNLVGQHLQAWNGKIDAICGPKDCLIRAVEIKKNQIVFVSLVKNCTMGEMTLKNQMADVTARLVPENTIAKIDLREMTAAQFSSLLGKYSIKQMKKDRTAARMRELLPDISAGSLRCGPDIWEDILKVPKKANFKAKARKLKADAALMEELDRICSENHPKQYRGIPVHYRISATSWENAREIAIVLMQALYENHRICSKRVTHLKAMAPFDFMGASVEKVFRLCSGGCVVMELFEEEGTPGANPWERFSDDVDWSFWDDGGGDDEADEGYGDDDDDIDDGWGIGFWPNGPVDAARSLAATLEKYMHETQLIFIENAKHPGFSRSLSQSLKGKISFVEIKEGLNSALAQRHFDDMVAGAGLTEYDDGERRFEDSAYYAAEDVEKMFRQFSWDCMRERIYTEYSAAKLGDKEKADEAGKHDPRLKLQRLIGLESVKEIVGDIIAVHKVEKMRGVCREDGAGGQSKDSRVEKTVGLSRHMLFAGNPGTAKTTVARLMAQIMKEEGLLKTGRFVECGRADLVGQYVGWTAVQVKRRFREARGGILFIDEAYSLVDDSNSFGDEAIHTIVAEMENLRDEVLVIFAGYPAKMQAFLGKNEGLKSRISYHVSFPDYTPEELLRILEKLAEDRDFTLTDDAKGRAREIFGEAHKGKDFGNGRFARNLLEKAILRQASRIMALPEGKVNEAMLFELTAEDFAGGHTTADGITGREMRKIGFAAGRGER